MGVQRDFYTRVADGAIVAPGCFQLRRAVALCTHGGGELQLHQHVLRLLAIPVDDQVDTVFEEA